LLKVIKYVTIDILRNRIILAYTAFLLLLSLSLFNLEDNPSKGLLSMLNIVLIMVPLVSLIFSTIYMYNASEFIELLLSQPIRRSRLLFSMYAGLALSLVTAFAAGAGLPMLLMEGSSSSLFLTVTGCALSAIFAALAVLGSVVTRDKARGIGIAILIWLFCSILYDGILLLIMFQLSDYPLEKAMLVLCSFNPVDLARILVLLKLDISALMGYTGAIYREFFGSSAGIGVSAGLMLAWLVVPLAVARRIFRKKDL
jgi:Cu-processing system permease protein